LNGLPPKLTAMKRQKSVQQREPRSSRRQALRALGAAAFAVGSAHTNRTIWAEGRDGNGAGAEEGDGAFFLTRGVVLALSDLRTLDWPARARRAGLSTIATHIFPHEVAQFVQMDDGRKFLQSCRRQGLQVEHELHAMSDLLPRSLFDKDPAMFPMTDNGDRVRDYNLCVHSQAALDVVAENAIQYTKVLRSTTSRYFYWIDDGRPMCRCPKCRDLSDSDQALLLEHHVLQAIRQVDPQAKLAHLSYSRTLQPPTQIKPLPGIFLEFAPIERSYDVPFRQRELPGGGTLAHGRLLDALDANLAWFGCEGAQALEYWLDLSRFSGWNRQNVKPLPWNGNVFRDDLRTYAGRGVRHVTTFAVWLDGPYVERFGEPPLEEYGAGFRSWRIKKGRAMQEGR
jgi:hypothetical protein